MKLFKKNSKSENKIHRSLDEVLFYLPGTKTPITYRDIIEGVLITGQTGSGKSSGPGKYIALAMLRQNFGFVVPCVKPEERQTWEEYAALTGRTDDLVIFSEDSPYQFNVLEYELQRTGRGAGETLNLVNILMSLNEQIQIHQGGSQSGDDEKFWDQALRRLLRNCIELLKLASEPVSIANMERLVTHSFNEPQLDRYTMLRNEMQDIHRAQEERERTYSEYKGWVEQNYFLYVFEKAGQNPGLSPDEVQLLQRVGDYWLMQWPTLSEKTKSIVTETFMGLTEPFSSGILQSRFSEGLSPELFPENSFLKQKIIIIDFPVKTYGLSGIYANTLYKTTFQSCVERREVEKETDPKPVTLFIDEYQNLVSPLTDSLFQLTARSSWVSCVLITQNINNLTFVMGKSMPEARAKSLLGNLNLKVFCSNSDFDTNQWASKMIGQHFTDKSSVSLNAKKEKSETLDQMLYFQVPPEHFTSLTIKGHRVQAVLFKAGKRWDKEGSNFALAAFNQNQS